MWNRFVFILKMVIPPILILIIQKSVYRYRNCRLILFDGRDATLFKTSIGYAKIYGEYGLGISTKWVLKYSKAKVICAETNLDYLNLFSKSLKIRESDLLLYCDIGVITGWGYPTNYDKRLKFKDYFDSIWQGEKPDFVLIDGRFRVACFLTSIINSEPGTRIIFDDYNREYYHVVEEVIRPTKTSKTQALFIRPNSVNLQLAEDLLEKFSNVLL